MAKQVEKRGLRRGPLPTVVLGVQTRGVPRVVGGKTYCTIHGRAHDDNGCSVCRSDKAEPKIYRNICFISKKVPASTKGEGGLWDGKNGRAFIGEVVSVHLTDTAANISAEEKRLKSLHGVGARE